MVQATALQEQLEQKIREIEQAVAGIDEQRATVSPAEGEWCVKEVLSHLIGAEQQSFQDCVKMFLSDDSPTLDLTPGDNYYTSGRESASIQELLTGVVSQYRDLGAWMANLTPEQFARTAHMPNFKETPLGDNPSLGIFLGGVITFHLTDHVQHLQRLCK